MKLASGLLLFFVSVGANAAVTDFFSADKATLLIQGKDLDAGNLYDAMNVVAETDGTIDVKHISYDSMYANPVFDLTCKKSQLTDVASCTLKFFSPGAVVNSAYKSVLMGINDRFDAPTTAKKFNETSSNPHQAHVFLSADGKLRIWKTFDSSGDVVSFTMTYN